MPARKILALKEPGHQASLKDTWIAEVKELKALLEHCNEYLQLFDDDDASIEEMLRALYTLQSKGNLSIAVLSATRIGETVNRLSKTSPVVDMWKKMVCTG
jgi:hypothetical protein